MAEFQASRDDPQLLDRWPADFRITAAYEVRAARLSATYLAGKPGRARLAVRLRHPSVFPPAVGRSVRSGLPRAAASAEPLGTGRHDPDRPQMPLDDAARFQQGQPFGDMTYDDVFTDLVHNDGRCEAAIDDPESARRIVADFRQRLSRVRRLHAAPPRSDLHRAVHLRARRLPAGTLGSPRDFACSRRVSRGRALPGRRSARCRLRR